MGSIATWDSMVKKFIMKFHHLSDHNDDEDVEEEEDPNETDNAPEIFMIEGNLFDFETPLCETFNEFNCFLKIDIDLFTYDIQDLKTYDEYEQELNNDEAKGTDEPWSEKRVPYQLCDHICEPYHFKNGKNVVGWYDELTDGKLKDEALALKGKIEGSWGDATPGVMKLCRFNPYLDTNRIFGRDYEASNVSCTQENQKDDPIPEPSNCKVRRFEVTEYSFNDNEEYITIKESEYLNHSKDSLDAYQELLRLIDDG
ncbi:hypothetical protein Tco_1129358 [Tanacetum coccineum]